MFHQTSRSNKRHSTVSSDKYLFHRKLPSLFGSGNNDNSSNSGRSAISSMSNHSHWTNSNSNYYTRQQQPVRVPVRVDLTMDGLECLESIFLMCVTSSENIPMANLQTFLYTFFSSTSIRIVLGTPRASIVLNEVCKLHNPNSHNQFVTWNKLLDLLECKTLINLPISVEKTQNEFDDYSLLLQKNGISPNIPNLKYEDNSMKHDTDAEDEIVRNKTKTRESERFLDLAMKLEEEMEVVVNAENIQYNQNNQNNEERIYSDNIYDRIDNLMLLKNNLTPVLDPNLELKKIENEKNIKLCEARFTVLTDTEISRVSSILSGPNTQEILIDKFNTEISRSKLLCLKPSTWLNDEVNRST